ncbi:MAG: choline monooxygenase, partial [Planctomycetota bacterium]
MSDALDIHADIRLARTPGAAFYGDEETHERLVRGVFDGSWQLLDEACPGPAEGSGVRAGWGDERLWVSREGGRLVGCSDVCTHRGHPLEMRKGELRCGYHGRRYELGGRCKGQPGMEGCEGFPGEEDRLLEWQCAEWGPLVWGALEPGMGFGEALTGLDAVGSALDLEGLVRDPAGDRVHEVAASWVLYVENYLEGLHVPFVHPGLAGALELSQYSTRLLERGVMQVGRDGGKGPELVLPEGHVDGGEGPVAALYLWCFPNLMLNVYPWGLSVNQVEPAGPGRCRVRYMRFVSRPELLGQGAGAELDQVELEDQRVVEAVQGRMASRGRV